MKLACRLIAFLLPISALFGAANCTSLIPPGGAYDIIRSVENSTFEQLIEEYVYEKNFSSHDEAIKAGLSVGTIVYGVPLKVGGTFSDEQRNVWRRQYESRRKVDTKSTLYKSFEQLTLNVEVVRIVARCIVATQTPAKGVTISVEPVDDCHFITTFRFFPLSSNDREPQLTKLDTTGGVCQQPSTKIVPNGGSSVKCYRTWRDSFSVLLNSSAGTATSDVIDGPPLPGPEPIRAKPTSTEPATKTVTVGKNSIYYPTYEHPNPAGDGGHELRILLDAPGTITNVAFSAAGEGDRWVHQSAIESNGLPPEQRKWIGWSNEGHNSQLTFTITYTPPKDPCDGDCNYEKKHAEWLKATTRNCGPGNSPNAK